MADNRRTGTAVGAGALTAAVLFLLGKGGIGLGGGDGSGLQQGDGDAKEPVEITEQAPEAEKTPVEELIEEPVEEPEELPTEGAGEAEKADDGILTVRVHEKEFYLDDEPMSPEALEEALLAAYTEEQTVILQDDSAIKATYDEAMRILEKLSIPYSLG